MFGWKRSPRLLNHVLVASADIPIVNKLVMSSAVTPSVVGFTHSQEIGCQVARHYLASIYKYVGSKKTKCKYSWEKKKVKEQEKWNYYSELKHNRRGRKITASFPRLKKQTNGGKENLQQN